MLIFILEAAIRSLLMALGVWGAIRLLRVQTVLAQKVAWVLVLAAAAAMPFVMHVPFLTLNQAPVLPLRDISAQLGGTPAPAPANPAANTSAVKTITIPKPSAAHPFTDSLLNEEALPFAVKDVLVRNLSSDAPDSQPWASLDPEPAVHVEPAKSRRMSAGKTALTSSTATPVQSAFWSGQRIRTFAIAAYLAVAGILLVRILAGVALAFRIRRRAGAVADASLPGYAIDVRASSELFSPVTIGSTVILPADYAEWDEEKLRIVLAHEQSHVRQRDFYLQLAAAVHMAIFWFSPLGWWLQRKLSDLGEALSDRAGLEQASDPAAYAQILLDFAAKPRTTLAGVAMARSSNLSSRIERILNVSRFRSAFQSSRSHSYLAALLVPASLLAAVALIRVAPAVEAFAIIRGNGNVTLSGHSGHDLKKAREKYGKDFIWFERDGKSYVITDPAVLAQSQALFKGDARLEERQKQLEKQQSELDKQMALIKPDLDKAALPGPEFAAEMAKVNAELAQLQGDKLKKLIDESTKAAIASNKINQQELQQRIQERLGELQERIGEIQSHLGEMQGKVGERMGEMGEKQGKLGEAMGNLGEQMGKIGEEQGRRAEEDSRKLRSIIDKAFKDGKAKPVE